MNAHAEDREKIELMGGPLDGLRLPRSLYGRDSFIHFDRMMFFDGDGSWSGPWRYERSSPLVYEYVGRIDRRRPA